MRLKDKVIVITGGSGLLGKAIIVNLIKEGAIIVNLEINIASTNDLSLLNCDITNQASVNLAIDKVVSKYGRIDGLINNAYPRTSDWGVKFENIEYDSWKTNVDWQLNSYFGVCQIVSKYMVERNKGSIVNMASIYGVVGPDFSVYEDTNMTMPAAYSAIKGGLINFSRYLASYLGRKGVRVNVVSPGGILDKQPESFIKRYSTKTPMGRMGTPEDIAPAVTFLLSDEAGYITGQNLIIDGGWTAI
jgi:NAD(P)-dependent dehydrogenase (short-subunit alcohol dehydrogenase family)